jgi:GNAT superfamily N-acetyltransferase
MSIQSSAGRRLFGPFTVRELHAFDEPDCALFGQRLDHQDVRMRFGSLRVSIRHLLPEAGGAATGVAFAALDPSRAIVGIVNLNRLDSDLSELAIIVRSDHKRQGIGQALIGHALHWAYHNRVSEVVGYVLVENRAMLGLARATGFAASEWDGYFVEIRRSTAPQSDRGAGRLFRDRVWTMA